jgi:hypothetical protein
MARAPRPSCATGSSPSIALSRPTPKVLDVAGWQRAVGVTDTYRSGRVFLVGDSTHVWPWATSPDQWLRYGP